MPRKYVADPRVKRRMKPDPQVLENAKRDIQKGQTYRKVAEKYNIHYSVLYRHFKNKNIKKAGGQTALPSEMENMIIKRLKLCSEWGYPISALDLRCIIKSHLDSRGIVIRKFRDNMPGQDFVYSFLSRHKKDLSHRMCQNIKRARAHLSKTILNEYFDNLEAIPINEIPAENILNYDETNLADDPGRVKIITKRGSKYPVRIMNHSKTSISIMMAAVATGELLRTYVVYKAQNLYSSWTTDGPKKARYNRSQSGWFDSYCFTDSIEKVVVPYFKDLPGKKLLIGDNLSSHLSLEAVEMCSVHDIHFVFLPANSTHATQPLDVAFFRPLKIAWRKILEEWKKGPGRKQAGLPKDVFPRLLKKLLDTIESTAKNNILAGFRKCGIRPLDRNQVLNTLPQETEELNDNDGENNNADDVFISFLKRMRYDNEATPKVRRKKITVAPGKSVTSQDFKDSQGPSPDADDGLSPTTLQHREDEDASNRTNNEAISDQEGQSNDDSSSDNFDSEVFKFARRFPNVHPVKTSHIKPGDWLIVGFQLHPCGASSSQNVMRRFYIGKIKNIDGLDYEGTFVRETVTKTSDGFVYRFPHIPDESFFRYDDIVGKLHQPQKFGRGLLQFKIHRRYLK